MKKVVIVNFNSVIPDLSGFVDVIPTDRLPDADAVIIWNDAVGHCRATAEFCRKLDIPVFVMQHGWNYSGVTEYQQHSITPDPKTHHFAWSESSKRLFMEGGVSEGNISVVGCPLYDLRVPKNVKGSVVLFAPAHAGDDAENDKTKASCNEIWTKLTEISGIKPFMKLCQGEHAAAQDDPRILYTDRNDVNHVRSVFKILSQVAVVVTHDEGTFSLLSYVMDIPVIKAESIYPKRTNGCDEVPLSGLESAIRSALANPEQAAWRRREVVEEIGGPLDESHKVTPRIAHELLNVLRPELIVCA